MRHKDQPEAGAALDRLVAEQVMGWHEDHCTRWFYGPGNVTGRHIGPDELGMVFSDNRCLSFFPSRNIAHAWEVYARLADLCGSFQGADGYAILVYADSASHRMNQKKACDPPYPKPDQDDDDDKDYG